MKLPELLLQICYNMPRSQIDICTNPGLLDQILAKDAWLRFVVILIGLLYWGMSCEYLSLGCGHPFEASIQRTFEDAVREINWNQSHAEQYKENVHL